MMGILLLILAVITLFVTLWNFLKKPTRRTEDRRSEYLQSAVDKLRGNVNHQHYNLRWIFQSPYERRREYYRNEYLKSEAWKRKRYVVLRRDNWRCLYCGARATQVHHTRYAKKNIGKEPIDWLVSVCKPCHDAQHQ
jgi:5-methylcytosine-specific restriction endonuclease McrA